MINLALALLFSAETLLKCYFSESLDRTEQWNTLSALQNKYKEEGKKEMSSSLYSQLPETIEMQLAKTVHEFQSEVLKHEVSVCSEL